MPPSRLDSLPIPVPKPWTPWGALLIAFMVVAGAVGHELWLQRKMIEANARQRLVARAATLSGYLGERLVQVAQALRGANSRYQAQSGTSQPILREHLNSIEAVLPWLRGTTLVDAQGMPRLAADGQPVALDGVRAKALRLARAAGRPDALVLLPPAGIAEGARGLVVAVPRIDAAGRFDGAAIAVMEPTCCEGMMEAIRNGSDTFLSIAHGDGNAFLFSPDRPDLAGRNLDVPGSFFRRHKEEGERNMPGSRVSTMAGMNQALLVEQWVVLQTVEQNGLTLHPPPVVAVGRGKAGIFAEWWADVLVDGILLAAFAAVGAIAAWSYQSRQRERQRLLGEAEKARRLDAERLRMAVEGASLGVWEYSGGRDGMLKIAPSTAAILGHSGAAIRSAADWRALVVPEDVGVLDSALDPPAGVRSFDAGALRIRGSDGETRVFRLRSGLFRGLSGDDGRVIGTVQDVTRQASEEARLEANEARLKAVYQVIPVGIAVTDSGGRVIDCNAASERLLGITRDQHLARVHDGRDWNIRYPDGRIMPSVDYPSLRALQTRQPVYDVEVRVETGDGERWLSVSAIPIRTGGNVSGEGGGISGVVIAYIDVGEARRKELELRKLTRALDQSGAAVVVTDERGVIEYVNSVAVSIYGYPERELLGKTPRVFKSGKTPDAVYQSMWTDIRSGRVWRGELVNRRRDGSIIHELVSISPVRDTLGHVTHFVSVREDLSERIENERLRQDYSKRISRIERMEVLGAMAGGVAHDFNNILVAILGFSGLGKLVLGASGGPPKVIAYFEEIEIAGNRAHRLVQQLLSFSRGGTVNPTRIDVEGAAREAISLVRASAPDSLRIELDLESGLPDIEFDPTQLSRLFANPLRNARDAMDGVGRVVVSIRRVTIVTAVLCDSCHEQFSGDYLAISVADQGCGVPESLRSRIFEPFFSTWRVADGAGMGLAVVHGILHTCGGHVRVLARPEGGTELQMLLPASLLMPSDGAPPDAST